MSTSFKTAYPNSWQWSMGDAGPNDDRRSEWDTTTFSLSVGTTKGPENQGDMPSIAMISEGVRALREHEHDGKIEDVVTAVIEIWQAMAAAKDGEA